MPVLDKILEQWEELDKVARGYLSPIQSEAQYHQAMELFGVLWDKVGKDAESPYASLFILLTERIAAYENRVYPIPEASPQEVLEFLLEQHSLTQSQLTKATGIHQSNLSQILAGKRKLTTDQVKRLANYFKVSPEVLL